MVNVSYWEQQSFFGSYDACIIGSGIVGLSSALVLKEREPGWKVIVLERGLLPSGASTKNAGFACFGSSSELLDDLGKMPEDMVFSIVEKRWKGLKKLLTNLKDIPIGYEQHGGYELFTDFALYRHCIEKIPYLNQCLRIITGCEHTFEDVSAKAVDFGFKGVCGMLRNRCEAQIDTGLMMRGLLWKAQQAGVLVLNGMGVERFEEQGQAVIVHLNNGQKLRAAKVLVATNGYAQQLLPELEVTPARAQVLITSEIEHLPFKGVFHYDRGYYYFRNVGQRVLLGGGRNLDFKAESTGSQEITEPIQQALEQLLRQIILPGKNYAIEMRWAGTMGLGPVKQPIVKKISPRLYCAVRMGGMGVAIGSLVGQEAVELMLAG